MGNDFDQQLFDNIFKINNSNIFDSYFNELKNQIKQDLKVEDILDSGSIARETRFRQNRIDAAKFNQLVKFFTTIIEKLVLKVLVYEKCFIGKEKIALLSNNAVAQSLDKELRMQIMDILRPKIVELNLNFENLRDEDKCGLELGINSENINKFIESLSSLNNTFDIDGKISKINVLKPDIVIIFLQDILARIIELIFNIDNLVFNNMLVEYYLEVANLINNFLDLSDKNIFDSIKLKRAKENLNRKKRFDRLSDELKHTQKLYRRFNLGNMFEIEDDITLNVFNGENLAENNEIHDVLLDEDFFGEADENEAMQLETGYNQDI